MNKYCIIVNPIAGKGAGRTAIPEIQANLDTLGVDYDLFVTEYPAHAIEMAAEAGSNGYSTVVAVGGDGTVNEVINGLMRALNEGHLTSSMAVLPVGRGNDFSYGMGIPVDLEAACKLLVEGNTRKIDIGFVKGEITRKVAILAMASGSVLIRLWGLKLLNCPHLSAAYRLI